MNSIPDRGVRGEKLQTIPGTVPSIFNFPPGCRFCNRCPEVMPRCREAEPELLEIIPGHAVRCFLVEEKGQV